MSAVEMIKKLDDMVTNKVNILNLMQGEDYVI